jgi:hypothetical protein
MRAKPKAERAAGAAKKPKRMTWPGDKPTGKTRTFEVLVSKLVTVTIDESIFAQANDPEQPIWTPPQPDEAVVEHLVFNRVCNALKLGYIDGFANCPEESVELDRAEWQVECEREVPKKARKRAR